MVPFTYTFKNKLEGLYGIFEPLTSKFGNDSFEDLF
jgi:hypothetical protein